jgi:hypothetical protein
MIILDIILNALQHNQAGFCQCRNLRLIQKYKIVFLRHGESTWNKENRFTGWTDVRLSASGNSHSIQESKKQSRQEKY